MREISVNKFSANIKSYVDSAASNHQPFRVNRREGNDFVVISAEDWERDQETLYVLQNTSLMNQLSDSIKTHSKKKGYKPAKEELDEINSL